MIFGITCLNLGLAIYEPYKKSEDANAFATPLEILPEWYLLTTFNFLRLLCSKFLGILSMLYLPGVFFILAFGENLNRYQNPFRRPRMVSLFLSVILYAIWLSLGPLEAMMKALPLI